MKVRFRKIYNEHGRLRDEIIEGDCDEQRWPGNDTMWLKEQQFRMFAPPRDAGDVRLVVTSPITKILFLNTAETYVIFLTKSGSVYSVEALPNEETLTPSSSANNN